MTGPETRLPTRVEALRDATRRLSAAGVAEALADARLLLLAAAELARVDLVRDPDLRLDAATVRRFEAALARRAAREPVSRILGTREFWGLTLAVTPAVLDPRPDTETLVAAVLEALGPRRAGPLRILDLGTGSGAILCALLAECPGADGIAIDRSEAACRVAQGNLAACGLATRAMVVRGDWAAAVAPARFDVVVSNPPYIATGEIAGLEPDVREHDPAAALDGGPDGLTAYRILARQILPLLAPSGIAALEIGQGQDGAVTTLFAGLADLGVVRDLAGIGRVVIGRRA